MKGKNKNILVIVCFSTKQTKWYNNVDTSKYRLMLSMCKSSFEKNLQNLDDIIIYDKEADTVNEGLVNLHWETKRLCLEEKYDLIVTDVDVLCLKPTEIFGKHKYIRGFYCYEQGSNFFKGKIPDKHFSHLIPWVCISPRYIPKETPLDVWAVGDELTRKRHDIFGWDMIPINEMIHYQYKKEFQDEYKKKLFELHDENMLHQFVMDPNKEDSNMIHYHSTRNIDAKINEMNIHYNKYIK